MTSIPLYQLDAFTDKAFAGNPAAVCPLDEWLADDVMQAIAFENNLSETAFYVPEGDGYRLRWFTPAAEVDLCGHATLASAWLILKTLEKDRESVAFETRSGTLTVTRDGELLVMDFPAKVAVDVDMPDGFIEAIGGITPERYMQADKVMAVLESEEAVLAVEPDLGFIKNLGRGVIVTGPGTEADCASRLFAPHVGIDEDPVTGSAHCTIVPYWAARLEKDDIHARQVSFRPGDLYCKLAGDRVQMGGKAKMVIEGKFIL